MGKVLETAYAEVQKSQFKFIDRNNFDVENAFIFWTNFAGKKNQFGSSARTFNLAIPADAAAELIKLGYRVREEVAGTFIDEATNEEVEAKVYFINVKVNFDSEWPPLVKIFVDYRGQKSSRLLDAETVGELDSMDIKTADVTIHSHMSKKFEGKCTGYLKKLYAIQEPTVVFGGKYDDWEENGVKDAELLGTPEDPDNPY